MNLRLQKPTENTTENLTGEISRPGQSLISGALLFQGKVFQFPVRMKDAQDWITDFLDKNKFFGTRLFNSVVSGEITGKVLLNLKPVLAEMPRIIKIPFHNDNKYEVVLRDSWDPESIEDVVKEEERTEKYHSVSRTLYT